MLTNLDIIETLQKALQRITFLESEVDRLKERLRQYDPENKAKESLSVNRIPRSLGVSNGNV